MISRRTLLRGLAGLGASAGAAALFGRRRKARAATPPRAQRLLVLNADGGMRTTMAFRAQAAPTLNPWGRFGPAGALSLGNVLFSSPGDVSYDAPSWGGITVPDFTQVAPRCAIVSAVDHAPGQARAGDHSDDTPRMGTGWFGVPSPGLCTVVSRALAAQSPLPALDLGGTGWLGAAPGEWAPFAPVAFNPAAPPSGASLVALPRGAALEDALDAGARTGRRGLAAAALDAYLAAKVALRRYGPLLTRPELSLGDPARLDAASGPVSNRMLLEAAGNFVTDGDCGHPDGVAVATALRALQLGAPVVALGVGGFDTHSGEAEIAPGLYTRFARYLAGIHFALARIPDPTGAPLLDSTLVVTTSELGRNSGSASYDDHDGSDHGGDAPWRWQAHLALGAGVAPIELCPTDDGNAPLDGVGGSTQNLLATVAGALGVDDDTISALWPPSSPLRPESTALPLWGG